MDQEMMLSVCLDSSTNMLRDQLACHQEEKLAVEEMRVLLWLGQDNCPARLSSGPWLLPQPLPSFRALLSCLWTRARE